MSLLLQSDHHAWQQRVSKEILTASRAIDFFTHSSSANSTKPKTSSQLNKSRQRSQRKKVSTKDQVQTFIHRQNVECNQLKIYSEVRGKYARPAPKLNIGIRSSSVKRPQTGFLYRPKSANGERREKCKVEEEFDPFLEYLEKSCRNDCGPLTSMSVRGEGCILDDRKMSQGNSLKDVVIGEGEEGGNRSQNEEIKEKIKENNENKEKNEKIRQNVQGSGIVADKNKTLNGEMKSYNNRNEEIMTKVQNVDEDDKKSTQNRGKSQQIEKTRPKSAKTTGRSSSKTASSVKKKYILELEKVLREEKMKRIQLEELLNSFELK